MLKPARSLEVLAWGDTMALVRAADPARAPVADTERVVQLGYSHPMRSSPGHLGAAAIGKRLGWDARTSLGSPSFLAED